MKTKEVIKEMSNEGFILSSSFKNNIYTVKIEKEGIVYSRTGSDFEQCVKSLKFDMR